MSTLASAQDPYAQGCPSTDAAQASQREGQVGAFPSWMWGLEQVSWPPVGVSGLTVRIRHRAL